MPTTDTIERKPQNGELTGAQAMRPNVGFSVFGFTGYGKPAEGSYRTYRAMIADPTIALARAVFTGPIIAGTWTFETTGDDVPDDYVELVQSVLEPMRPTLIVDALRSLDYGWQPFEKVWDGGSTLDRLKALLPDMTTIEVEQSGAFVGIRQDRVALDPVKCLVVNHDVEAGNFYGRSRLENLRKVWSRWNDLDDASGRVAKFATSVIPQVHYPEGRGRDATGREWSNFELAQQIVNNLQVGNGVTLPNLAGNVDSLINNPDLAGKSQWVISFLAAAEASGNLTAISDRQRYYDSLKMRGYLVPERAATEAQTAGSRADSETGADSVLLHATLVDRDIARQISWYVADDILELNYGPDARGKVRVVAAPLADAKKAMFKQVMATMLANTATLDELLPQLDVDAIIDALELPKSGNQPVSFGPIMPPADKPMDPRAAQQVADDYARQTDDE